MSANFPAVIRKQLLFWSGEFTFVLANKKEDSYPIADHGKRMSLRYSFLAGIMADFPIAPWLTKSVLLVAIDAEVSLTALHFYWSLEGIASYVVYLFYC